MPNKVVSHSKLPNMNVITLKVIQMKCASVMPTFETEVYMIPVYISIWLTPNNMICMGMETRNVEYGSRLAEYDMPMIKKTVMMTSHP